ncbi:MAG: PilZ domain-containing protein [Polyangiaceae bacterium]
MSDPASTARSARESLSRGLNALQSDPNLPPALMDLAAPIAQAMGALHQIERSNGTQLLPHANVALENVRTALSALQTQGQQFPAVALAMESVAGSLGLVHALSKLAGGAPPQQTAAPAQQAQQAPPQQFQPAAQPVQQQPRTQPVQQQVAQQPPQQAFPQPQQFQPQPVPAPQQQAPVYAAPPQAQYVAAADPFAAPRAPQQPAQSPMAATAYGGPPPQAAPQPNLSSPAAAGDLPPFAADLGAQSSTNFYKGLSGNDIIDHGGLFISTYKIPKIGTPVRLRVSLPGGYEFEANAVVRWSRESSEAGEDEAAPPGFGAQFTHITNEARQLVYRYVRNREPLFHDDL